MFTCVLIPISGFAVSTGAEYEYTICDGKATLTRYLGEDTSVVVPDKIDGFDIEATYNTFSNNQEIKKVKIPKGIRVIGERTFYNCKNLKKVAVSNTVEEIGYQAFAYSGIARITLPKKTNKIGQESF